LRVKSYPNLSLAILKQRRDKPYRIWLVLRGLNVSGSGMIHEQALWQYLKHTKLLSKRTATNALKEGDGTFWERYRGMIFLTGLLPLADKLDTNLYQHPVFIDIPSGLGSFRHLLVESYFANKPRMIALATIAKLTGRTRQTAITYLRGCNKTTNLMLSNRSPQDHVIPELASQGYYRTTINGRDVLVKRMPNTYSTDHKTAAIGKVKEQAKPSSLSTGALRRYFDKAKAARRAVVDERTIYTILGKERKQIVWHGWTRVFGDITAV